MGLGVLPQIRLIEESPSESEISINEPRTPDLVFVSGNEVHNPANGIGTIGRSGPSLAPLSVPTRCLGSCLYLRPTIPWLHVVGYLSRLTSWLIQARASLLSPRPRYPAPPEYRIDSSHQDFQRTPPCFSPFLSALGFRLPQGRSEKLHPLGARHLQQSLGCRSQSLLFHRVCFRVRTNPKKENRTQNK